LEALEDEVQRLKASGCRFNCGAQKEAFTAGFAAGYRNRAYGKGPGLIESYEAWK
jgi:hypothetical protein